MLDFYLSLVRLYQSFFFVLCQILVNRFIRLVSDLRERLVTLPDSILDRQILFTDEKRANLFFRIANICLILLTFIIDD